MYTVKLQDISEHQWLWQAAQYMTYLKIFKFCKCVHPCPPQIDLGISSQQAWLTSSQLASSRLEVWMNFKDLHSQINQWGNSSSQDSLTLVLVWSKLDIASSIMCRKYYFLLDPWKFMLGTDEKNNQKGILACAVLITLEKRWFRTLACVTNNEQYRGKWQSEGRQAQAFWITERCMGKQMKEWNHSVSSKLPVELIKIGERQVRTAL